jgi:hypothetical protein
MNFVDSTLVGLADETTRSGLFDQTALEQLLTASYDVDAMGPLQGTYTAVFEEFELGYPPPGLTVVEGAWSPIGAVERTEARFKLGGLGNGSLPRVDALWRGSIKARFAEVGEPITDVEAIWPVLEEVDDAVAAANGGVLPTGSTLEQSRRTELLDQMRTAFKDVPASPGDPFLFTDADLDAMIASVGATKVKGFLELVRSPENAALAVQLRFAAPVPVATKATMLPVVAALLIRPDPLDLALLVHESKELRERLGFSGIERPPNGRLRVRHPILVAWVVPASVFNDTDWPGANNVDRRDKAGAWLGREGIGLVVIP